MAWLCVDSDGQEVVFFEKPVRDADYGLWCNGSNLEDADCANLPKGSIKKLIGRELNWDDEPEDIDNIVARQRQLKKDSYTVRINKSTVIIKTKNK